MTRKRRIAGACVAGREVPLSLHSKGRDFVVGPVRLQAFPAVALPLRCQAAQTPNWRYCSASTMSNSWSG